MLELAELQVRLALLELVVLPELRAQELQVRLVLLELVGLRVPQVQAYLVQPAQQVQ